MPDERPVDVTLLLRESRAGDAGALARLLPAVYDELRRLAASYLRRERAGHTLQPTALAHEAWIRLVDATRVEWRDRAQFLAIAARSMRQILVDHARTRDAIKRGGAHDRVTLSRVEGFTPGPDLDVLALEEALEALEALDPRKARIVELRFYGGLTAKEAASALGVSETTVENEWRFARAWLANRLDPPA